MPAISLADFSLFLLSRQSVLILDKLKGKKGNKQAIQIIERNVDKYCKMSGLQEKDRETKRQSIDRTIEPSLIKRINVKVEEKSDDGNKKQTNRHV